MTKELLVTMVARWSEKFAMAASAGGVNLSEAEAEELSLLMSYVLDALGAGRA